MTATRPPGLGAREIAGAVTWSASGDLTSKVAVVAVSVMAARTLAPERFATYIGLLAAAYLGAAAWDAGVSTLVSLERSRSRAPLSALAERVARARLRSFPAWLAAFALASVALGMATRPTAADIVTFALVSLAISLQQPILAALRADLHFRGASFAIFAGRWLTVAILGGALALGFSAGDVGLVGIAHLFGEATVAIVAVVVLLRQRPDEGDVAWDRRSIRLRNALPYAANSLISIAYSRLDVLLVAVLVPAAQLAAYAPASRIQDALYFLPSAIAVVALPYLSRQSADAHAARWRTMQRLWLIGLLVTVPSAVALTVFMPEVINVVLGSEYAPAALPSKILAWSMPLAVIGGPLLAYLISRGRGVQTTAAFAVAGVVSLALHVILDPRFGAVGAAVASLARDAANVAVAGLLVWRAHGLDDVSERERIEPATRQRQQPVDRDPLKGLDRVRLLLARPFLHYLSGTGISRGKGFITRRILPGILPQPPTSFSLVRPGGTRIRLLYGEVLGIAALVHGGFEDAECRRMLELAMPGTVAIDAGANVGIHTIPLASRLAPGMVIAVEPLQGNAERLLANASLNAIVNIDLHVVAAGSSPGLVNLHLASDGAFVSTGQVVEHRAVGSAVKVEQTTLDVLWETAGRPAVSLIKVDVEGEETGVMLGAKRLLSQERPAIVAEASTPEALSKFSLTLAPHGYRRVPAEGFQPWNHLFLAGLDRNEGENAETLAPGATLGET